MFWYIYKVSYFALISLVPKYLSSISKHFCLLFFFLFSKLIKSLRIIMYYVFHLTSYSFYTFPSDFEKVENFIELLEFDISPGFLLFTQLNNKFWLDPEFFFFSVSKSTSTECFNWMLAKFWQFVSFSSFYSVQQCFYGRYSVLMQVTKYTVEMSEIRGFRR